MEEPEVKWQMGEDPDEELRNQHEDAARLVDWLEQPEVDHRVKVAAEEKARRELAEREHLAAEINRKLLGLPPPTKEARLAVLMADLERLKRGGL